MGGKGGGAMTHHLLMPTKAVLEAGKLLGSIGFTAMQYLPTNLEEAISQPVTYQPDHSSLLMWILRKVSPCWETEKVMGISPTKLHRTGMKGTTEELGSQRKGLLQRPRLSPTSCMSKKS